jgi:hypothetical protein
MTTGLVIVPGMAFFVTAAPPVEPWAAPACDDQPARGRSGHWFRRRRHDTSTVLDHIRPFDRYPAKVVDHLGRHADRLRLREGTVIAERGRHAHEVVAILAGEVRTADGPAGAPLEPGAWVGPRQLLAGEPHDRTLVAGPGVDVVVLNGPAYRWAAANLPGLADDTA